MQHFIKGDNCGLCICRQQSTFDFQHIFITNCISDINNVSLQTKETTTVFLLHLYHEHFGQTGKVANLNAAIVAEIPLLRSNVTNKKIHYCSVKRNNNYFLSVNK
ncbi:MAG: hypothetical protein LBJ17_02780 [Dysgonamonadaceae bacterium]|jgi:hypothetical protein|nr:hypothetical protein [Dysgonamonadaceae bacterium]